ncbi:MAG TPA: magnesium chelatase, partial [Chloroflexi bacterium]|nr:magnesium chelatase [Chloroflexota bacterium]
ALDATLRVAAPLQHRRRTTEAAVGLIVRPDDLRVKERRRRLGNRILFVVDASGSMAARRRMEAVKGAILGLLLDAYQKRDRVGLITFRGERAEVLLPPTNSIDLAERALQALPTGGRTPLAHALMLAGEALCKRGDDDLVPLLVLVSDGRANVGIGGDARRDAQAAAEALAARHIASLVLDSEQGFVHLGLARELAGWLGGDYLKLEELHADALRGVIRSALE